MHSFSFFFFPHIFIEIQTNISPYLGLMLVDIFVVLFFSFSCFLCNNNNKTKTMLWVIMVDNT